MEALPTSWLPTSCLHFEFCFRFSSMSHSVTTSPSLESPKCHSSSSSVQREGTGTGRKWQGSEAGRTAYFGQLCRHVIPSGRGLSQVIGGCLASEGLQGLSSVTFPGSLGIHCPLSLAGNAPRPAPMGARAAHGVHLRSCITSSRRPAEPVSCPRRRETNLSGSLGALSLL